MEIVTHRTVVRGVDQSYIEIPEGVTHIGPGAFQGFSNVEYVKLPSTLQEIGSKSFSNIEKLLSVDFSQCTRLNKIGSFAFFRCIQLRHVNLSNCKQLQKLNFATFSGCVKLVLHVPSTVTNFERACLQNVPLAAVSVANDFSTSMDAGLFPLRLKSPTIRPFNNSTNFYTDDYDAYADVFDAIGELNVIWVESLRRQSRLREAGVWTDAVIVEEAQTKNRVMELWDRIDGYDIQDSEEDSWLGLTGIWDIIIDGQRLVNMRSYQNQPEETKLFKELLDSLDIREPLPPSESRPAKRARRLMANLRF